MFDLERDYMATYGAVVEWQRGDAAFVDQRYSRAHAWRFDGGVEVPASASPAHVPLPMSRADAVDPEEAFVAAISSCHMLWFLALAAKNGFRVDSYVDDAVGTMAKNEDGRMAMTEVLLRPRVVFSGERVPDAAALDALHHAAHDNCYIANSVRTIVRCRARA